MIEATEAALAVFFSLGVLVGWLLAMFVHWLGDSEDQPIETGNVAKLYVSYDPADEIEEGVQHLWLELEDLRLFKLNDERAQFAALHNDSWRDWRDRQVSCHAFLLELPNGEDYVLIGKCSTHRVGNTVSGSIQLTRPSARVNLIEGKS